MIVYLKEKNCDTLKDHFRNFKEAFCCCLSNEPSYKSTSTIAAGNELTTLKMEDPANNQLGLVQEIQPIAKPAEKPKSDELSRYKSLFLAADTSPAALETLKLIEKAREELKKNGFTPANPSLGINTNPPPMDEDQIAKYESELRELNQKIVRDSGPQGTTLEAFQESLVKSLGAGSKSPAEA